MSGGPGNESMLLRNRNSTENLRYYEALAKFFDGDASDTLLKLRSFALYAPRQVISDFLVRYELFQKVLDIPGSIVECGVFNGQGLLSFGLFSAVLEPNNVNRVIYGLDTFEGFPSISEEDRKGAPDRMVKGGYAVEGAQERISKAVDLFDQNRFIGHVPKIRLVKGDIVGGLDGFIAENPHLLVALLYLDVDLYQPTKVALEKLLPRVPKGGVIAFDELNMKEYPGETQAALAALDLSQVELKRLPFCSRISYFVR